MAFAYWQTRYTSTVCGTKRPPVAVHMNERNVTVTATASSASASGARSGGDAAARAAVGDMRADDTLRGPFLTLRVGRCTIRSASRAPGHDARATHGRDLDAAT